MDGGRRALSGAGVLVLPSVAGVAASRAVPGLHYPSDVLAAIAIGCALAGLSPWLVPGVGLFC